MSKSFATSFGTGLEAFHKEVFLIEKSDFHKAKMEFIKAKDTLNRKDFFEQP